jgi:putative oxidoreductase
MGYLIDALPVFEVQGERVMNLNHPIVPLLGRLLISYIYITSGVAKLMDWSGNVTYMSRHHLPLISLLLGIAAFIEIGGSICLVTGFHARWAALVMFGYTVALTLLLHNYWSYTGDMAGMQETHFRKNLAIMGGLLMVTFGGPGKWALGNKD